MQQLIEELLYESESDSLDFKLQQYDIWGTSDKEKMELVKDILAFANSWRRTDAYILIGVEEVKSGPAVIRGITNHIDDATLQQLVNTKTNKPIELSYRSITINGLQVGVIHIPLQARPFFLTKRFGHLNVNTVYLRRGSSTDTATPDEIARMGAHQVQSSMLPDVNIQFADSQTHEGIGTILKLTPNVVTIPPLEDFPELGGTDPFGIRANPLLNSAYYADWALYMQETVFVQKAVFLIENTSSNLLKNVAIKFEISKTDNIYVLHKDNLYDEPSRTIMSNNMINTFIKSSISMIDRQSKYFIEILPGSIQPKSSKITEEFYIAGYEAMKVPIDVVVSADNLPSPKRFSLEIHIEPVFNIWTVKEIVDFVKTQVD